MIDFEEELKKFKPCLEVEEAEDAIYNKNLDSQTSLQVKFGVIPQGGIGLAFAFQNLFVCKQTEKLTFHEPAHAEERERNGFDDEYFGREGDGENQ